MRSPLFVVATVLSAVSLAASPVGDAAVASQVEALLTRTVRADGPGAVVLIARGDPAVPDAAGALVSTVDDQLRWMRALVTGRALGRAGFEEMIAPSPTCPHRT